jgi:hypothetical protein
MWRMESIRQRILDTFQHKNSGPIVYQPRIYFWYYSNRLHVTTPETAPAPDPSTLTVSSTVPPELRGKPLLEVFESVQGSPRYPAENLGLSIFRVEVDERRLKCRSWNEGGIDYREIETPAGQLREASRAGYHLEFLLKGPQDFAAMRHLLDASTFHFDREAFDAAERAFADRGVTQSYFPRAPLQRMFIELMGFEPALYALLEHPDETQELLDAIAAWDDAMYDVLCSCPVQILNFGENIDANMDSPQVFDEHLGPYYTRRVAQLRAAGKLTHIHGDGALRGVLKRLVDCGFDGIEAATPVPQGDLTIEEIKEAMGDTVLLDGIPAIAFLPNYPMAEFERVTQKVIDTFSPNLILGASDEVPPGGEYDRVRIAGEMAARTGAAPGR